MVMAVMMVVPVMTVIIVLTMRKVMIGSRKTTTIGTGSSDGKDVNASILQIEQLLKTPKQQARVIMTRILFRDATYMYD